MEQSSLRTDYRSKDGSKILAIVSAVDLSLRQAVPAWWQLLKGLYELGLDVVVTPYVGRGVETLWWKTYGNPCERESLLVNRIIRYRLSRLKGLREGEPGTLAHVREGAVRMLTRALTVSRWRRHIEKILDQEGDVLATIFFNIPLNQIQGIPSFVRKESGAPVVFYDMDLPDSLPKYATSRLAFSYYVGADLSEYDAFITNSEGAIAELREMGAPMANAVHFGVDPSVYCPVNEEKTVDVFFYGQGAHFRENWVAKMITEPSRLMRNRSFMVGGKFAVDLGKAQKIEDIPISTWRRYACKSKINLNITRRQHAEVYCSSTSRIFELACLGSCIVSNPVNGLEKWFDLKKEVRMVGENDILGTYEELLSNEDARLRLGLNARNRVLKEHTHVHMATKVLNTLKALNQAG